MNLPRAFDIVGDIAVVNVESDLEAAMAQKVMEQNKRVKVVVNKIGKTEGVERIQRVKVVAGEGRTETLHKENGCRFKLDLNRVFFTPRLSSERLRVAEQVGEKETVVDMFSGVGPFSILIAKLRPKGEVYSVDVNEDAVSYLKGNIRLNKVDNVIALWGDVSDVCEKLGKVADRVIMNLPEGSGEFLGVVGKIAKRGCVVHFYCFLSDEELFDAGVERIREVFPKAKILNKVLCGERAPGIHRVCIDFKVG